MSSMTFRKSERLYHKKQIQELFNKGSSFYIYPFKVLFISASDATMDQILISVPKRNFKKAVQRNKIKRRIREAYRLNKHRLHTAHKLRIAYIYTAKELLEYKSIENKMIAIIERLNSQISP